MKKLFLLFAFTLITVGVFAQWNFSNDDSSNEKNNQVILVSSDIESSVVQVSTNNYTLSQADPANSIAFKVSADDAVSILSEGNPDLAKFAVSVIIPDDAEMQVDVLSSEFTDYENIEIAPSKGNLLRTVDPATIPLTYGAAYSTDEFYPGILTDLGEPYILRDFRGQVVNIYPFQYNPVSKVLRVYSEITVNVIRKSNQGANVFTRTKQVSTIDKEFKNIYDRQFLNFKKSPLYTPLDEHGNMLVICYDAYMSAMQPFVDWKNTIGIQTEMVSVATAGGTAAAIQNYVENYYNTNGLTFLLLVGDAAQCPTLSSNGGGSDNMYGYITGGDYYQEILIGRFSAESVAHVQTQVDRTINYELTPSTTPGLFSKCIGIASAEGPGDDNEYDYAHERGILSDFMGFTYTAQNELFDGSQGGIDAAGDPSAANLSTILNAGAGVITYTGHGSDNSFVTTGFSNTDVENLTNTEMQPFIFAVACVNGNFTAGTCFAEGWLRATHNNLPAGSIATFMSTINQSWDPPMEGQDEMVDILVESYTSNIKRSFAGISVNGLFQMNDTYQDYAMTDTWTVFGDPSVMIRTSDPKTMTVTHQPTINLGANQLVVNCDVEGAFIALTINHEIIGTGYATGGSATINFDPLMQIDTITVAATAFNYIPYIGEVLIMNSVQVDATPMMILQPQSNYNCPDIEILPSVILENFGMNDLTSVTIDCQFDGTSIGSIPWTGTLASFESDTIVFAAVTLTTGSHTITFTTTSPNGTTDGNTSNDVITRNINVQDLTISSDFTSDQTEFCTTPAEIQFSNLSQNAQNYLWNFGDGNSSTDENPIHSYGALGTYTVVLTADAGACGSSVKTMTDYVTVGIASPVVADTTLCGPGVAVLNASGQGTLVWYDAISGGNIVNVGNVFTTPNLTANTTYYVQDSIEGQTSYVGETDNTANGSMFTSSSVHYLVFDCYSPVTLATVEVNAGAAGNRTISLQNSSGTTLQSVTINIPAGVSRISLNFDIPVGTDLRLVGPASPNLWRNDAGLSYPYDLSGLISIKYSSATSDPTGRYYYFYDWELKEQACLSALAPVTAFINNDAPIADFSYVVNGLTVNFTDQSQNPAVYYWSFGDDTYSSEASPVHSYAYAGFFDVTLIVTNGCSSDTIIQQISTTGAGFTEQTSLPFDLQLYPNPSTDGAIYIHSPGGTLTIFNSNGKQIEQKLISKGIVSIQSGNYAEGIYYFVLTNDSKISTSKVIISR